ncbi:hypothetical protein M8J76_014236 [Diaphorina citri]|nr:hypothetical protein M8J76_014236 [Diaphorina citri]
MSESGVAVIANIENACFPLGLSAVKACHAGVALSDISNSDMMNEALGTVTSMKRPLTDEEDIDVAEVKKLKLVEGVEPDSVVNGKGSIDEESVIDKVSAIDAELAVAETNAKTNGKEDKEVAETKDDNDAKANGNDVELIEADMQDGPSEKESDLNDEGQTNNAEAQTKTEEGANSSADVEIPEAKLESNVNSSTNLIASSDSLRNDPPNDVNIPNDLCDNSKDTDVTLAPSNNAASVNSPDGTNCEKTDLASVRTHVEPDEKDKLDENDSIKPHEKDSSKPIEKESNSHVREDTPDSPTNGDISINTHSTDLLENIQHIESSSSSPSNENTVQLKTNCDLNSEAKTDTNGEAKESSFDDPEKEDKEDDDSFTISIHKILEESDSEIKCDDSVYSKPTEVGDQSIELEEEAKILCDDVKPVVEVQESKEDIKEEIIEDVPIVEEIKSTNLVKDEIEDLVSTDKEDTKLRIEAVDNEDLVVADKGDLKDKVTVSTKEEIEEEKPSVVDIEISTVDKPVDVKLDNTPQTNNLTEPDKKSTESVEKQSNAIEQTDIEIGEIKSPLKSSANDTCLNSDKLEPSISPSEEDVIPTDASKPDMDNISCMDAEMEDSSSEKVETVKSEAVSENMNTEDPKNDEGSRSKPCDEELDSDISEEPKAKKIKLDVENDVEMVSTSNKDSVIDGSNENITKTAITEPDVELIDLDKEQKDEIKKSSPESTPIVESTSESEVTSKLEESPVAQPIESQKLDEIGTINDETSIKPSKISETITINDELEENSESLQTNQSNDEKSAKESLDNLQAINSAPENVATRDSVTAEIQESVVNTSEKADQNKSKDTSNLEVNKDSTIPSNQENEEKKEADKESTQQPESIKQTEPVEVTKNETVADKILENSSQIVKESINDDIELIENSATQIDDKPKDILNDLSEKDQSSGDTAHVEETKTDTSADGSQKSDQPSEANAVLDSEVKPTEDSTKKKDVEKLIEETATKNTDTTSNKDSTSEDKSPELSEVVGDTDATVDKILEEIDETLKENEVSLDADIEKDEGKLLEETEPNVGPEESTEEKADKGKTDDAEDAEMLSLVIDEKTDSDVELIELPDDEKTKEMDTTKPQETEKEPLNEAAKKVIDIEMEIDNATSILNESPEKTSQSAIRPEIELEMDDALSSLNGSPNKTAQPANEATVETTEKKTDDKNEDDDDIVFIKCCKRGLEKLLSRTFLKYFAYESEVGKLRELLGKLQVENATIKTLCLTQAKQLKELGHVHDKAVEEIRAYRGEDKGLPLAPVKITRSVGLQVNVVVAEKKRTGPGTYSRSVASLKRDQRARNAPRTPTASPGAWSSPPNKTSPGTSPRVGVPRAVVPVQRKSLPVPGLTPRAGRPVSARPMTPSPTGGLRILPPRAVNAAIRSPGVRQVNLGRVITRAPMIRTTGVSHNVPPGTSISVKPSGVETINLDDDDAGNAPRNNIKIVRSARGPSTPIRLTTAPTSMANNKIQPGSPRLAYVPISQGYKLRPATGTTGSILTTLPNTSTATTTTYVLETSAGLIPFQTNNVRLNLKPNATASQPVKLNYLGGNGSRLQTGSNEEAASVANEVQVASNEVLEVMHAASNEVTEGMPVPSNEVTEEMHVASNEVTEEMHVASNEVTKGMPVPSNEVTEGMPVPSNEVTEGMPVPSNEVTEEMHVASNEVTEGMPVPSNEVTEVMHVASNEVTEGMPVASNEVTEEMHVASNEVTEGMPVASNEVTEEMHVPSNEVTQGTPVPSNEVTEGMPVPSNVVTEGMPVPSNEVTEGMPVPSNEVTEGMPVPSNEVTEGMPVPSNEVTEGMPVPSNEVTEGMPVPSNEVTEGMPVEKNGDREEMNVETNEVTGKTIEKVQVISNEVTKETNKEIQAASIEEMPVPSNAVTEKTIEELQVVLNKEIQVSSIEDIQVSNGEMQVASDEEKEETSEDGIQVVFNEVIQVVSNGEAEESFEGIQVSSDEDIIQVVFNEIIQQVVSNGEIDETNEDIYVLSSEETLSVSSDDSEVEITHVSNFTRNGTPAQIPTNEEIASNEEAALNESASFVNTQSALNEDTQSVTNKETDVLSSEKASQSVLTGKSPSNMLNVTQPCKFFTLNSEIKRTFLENLLKEEAPFSDLVEANCARGCVSAVEDKGEECSNVAMSSDSRSVTDRFCGLNDLEKECPSSELSSVTDGSCDFKDLVKECPNPDVSFEEVEVLSDAFDSDKCGSPYDEDVEICGPPPGSFSDLYDSPFVESSANVNRSACVLRGVKEELIASCVIKTEPVESILGPNFQPLVVISGDVLNTEDFRKNQEISEEFTKLEARRKSVAKGKKVEKAHPKILDTNQLNRGEIFDTDLDLCTPKSDVTAGKKSPHVRLKKVNPSGKKIVRTKGRIHFCIFCKKNVPPQFSKHLFMMHKEEPQVEAILKLDPTDAIRKWLMSKIRMEGDMANRIERNSNGMMKSGRHQKEPESRLMKAKKTARIRKVETVECPFCKRKLRGNLKRHIRRRHLRFKTQVAGFVEDNTSQREGQTTVNSDQENHTEKAHENSRKTEQRSNTSTDDIEKIDALPTLLTNTQHCKENEHTLATSLEEYAMDNAVLEQAVPRNFQQPNTEKNVRKESRSFYCILCKKTVKRFSRHLEFSHRKHPQVKAIMGLDSTNISRKRVISKLRIQGDLILRNSNMFHRVKGTRTPCPYCTINYAQKALPNHIKKCAFRDTSEEASENNGHPKENTSQGKIIEEKEKEHTEKASDDNGEMVNDASEGGKSFDESSKAAAPTLEDRLFAENSENESGKANNTSVNSSGDNEHADDDLTLGELWSKRLANIENRKGEELKNGNGEEIVNVSGGYITKENIAEINKDSEEKINKVSDVKISKGKRIKIRKDHTKNMCNDKGKKNTYTKKGTRDNVRKYNRKKVNVDNLDKASKDNRDYVNKNYEAKLSKKNVDTSNTNNEESIDNDETKSNTSDTEEFTESLTLADRVKIRRPNSDLEVSKYSRQKTSYNGEKTSYNGEKTSTRICNDEETCTESCTIEKTRTMNCNVQKNHNMSCNNGEEIKVTQGKMNQYNETSDSSSDEFTEASLKAGRIKRYRASPDPEYIPRNRLHGSQKRLRPSSPDPEYLPKVRLHGQQPRRRASNANPEYVPTNSSHEPKQRRRPNKTPRIPCNWTPEQRNAVVDHFSEHIRLKKLPSKLECQTLIDRDFPLFVDKTAWNVKVLVQNIRSGLYRRELDRAKASGQL